MVFVCGRYEGVDERVNDLLCDRELSIGDYVLSGGELAAAVVIDAVVRLLPGVLGNADSSRFESFGAADTGPAHLAGAVPPSTHGVRRPARLPPLHPARGLPRSLRFPRSSLAEIIVAIRRWRRERALAKTWQNRPDLLQSPQPYRLRTGASSQP